MPKCQAPGIGDHIAEVSPHLIRRRTLKIATPHVDDVVQRPAANHTVERQDQQCRDHPGKRAPGPFGRVPRLDRQYLQGIGRTLPGTPADQGFRQHDRHADQCDTGQEHQHEGAAAIDADHVREFPDTTQPHGRTGRGEYEDPAASPTAVDRNLVCRHRYHAQAFKKEAALSGIQSTCSST
ncbi:hypothetical protein D3C73_874620 [compost metagenome]